MEISRVDFVRLSQKQNFNLIMCDMDGENIFEFADALSNKQINFNCLG